MGSQSGPAAATAAEYSGLSTTSNWSMGSGSPSGSAVVASSGAATTKVRRWHVVEVIGPKTPPRPSRKKASSPTQLRGGTAGNGYESR